MSQQSGYLGQVSANLNGVCLSIISMHPIDYFWLLFYVDDCVYWYTSEALGKWFVDTLRNRFHVKFLGYAHWSMSIRISHMKDHYISIYQARYATYIV